jgi:hypothetical protein
MERSMAEPAKSRRVWLTVIILSLVAVGLYAAILLRFSGGLR